jgi:lipopolysaccharide/colanic/teichoic acid biosynthesis glycosyltransferase
MNTGGWKRFRLGIKRVIDIVISAALLVMLSPVYVTVYLLIRLRLGNPVLFQQERPGLHGEIFTVQKFRTMMKRETEDGRRLTDSERIGRLGKFLRKTSLDELPQLINVLRGDMSLVGPRPLLIEYLPKYTPEQARRHDMRPGITGWAQVNGRNYTKFSERFRLDVWYVDNWSLTLDARILWMTIVNVVRGSGVVTGQSVEDFDDVGFLTRDS